MRAFEAFAMAELETPEAVNIAALLEGVPGTRPLPMARSQ
jgi:hypothetical protein